MRIGVLSDVHNERPPRPPRRWINRYEPEAVLARLDAALRAFERAGIDVVLLLGDLTETGDAEALDEVLAALGSRPAAAVGGNHDGDGLAAALERHGIADASAGALASLAGVAVERVEAGSEHHRVRRFAPAAAEGMPVVASHFPLLSERERLTAAGMPYSGDLVDREEALASLDGPAVVLSGHIHARCSRAAGAVLQLTVGALIEPPFDTTIVEIAGGEVTRTAQRLGPRPRLDPVFAPDRERWRWSGAEWTSAA